MQERHCNSQPVSDHCRVLSEARIILYPFSSPSGARESCRMLSAQRFLVVSMATHRQRYQEQQVCKHASKAKTMATHSDALHWREQVASVNKTLRKKRSIKSVLYKSCDCALLPCNAPIRKPAPTRKSLQTQRPPAIAPKSLYKS